MGRRKQRESTVKSGAAGGGRAKKYAQLVEAQSPEPREAASHDENIERLTGQDESAPAAAAMTRPQQTPTQIANNPNSQPVEIDMSTSASSFDEQQRRDKQHRKESQCSQVSSSVFPSSSSTISDGQMIIMNDSVCAINSTSTSSGRGTQMTRTISRSMLELDQAAAAAATQSHDVRPFQVSWSNLSFNYEPSYLSGSRLCGGLKSGSRKRSTRHVLNDISGSFRSNQLIAIIGPSGCGKTTLLQFLAGNNRSQADRLLISGLDEPKVAFIGQDDCLLPGLTARETLIYASRLQNTEPTFDHHQHIQPILSELGLLECADRSVTKLSGGQMKRVTIAQELLYPTNILILDEVTSGLDASTSYSIVKLLKQLVSDHQYPMSIVMSIHQPSARLFAVFDQVYVMSDGCCLYEGSCSLDLVNAYLARFNLECPKFHNIADYLIEIASDDLSSNQLIKGQLIQYQRKHSQHQQQHLFSHHHHHQHNNFDTSNNNINNATMNGISSIPIETVLPDDDDDDVDELKSQGISMLLMTAAATANNQDETTKRKTLNSSNHHVGIENNQDASEVSLFGAIERARSRRDRPMMTHFWVHLSRSMLRIRRSYILTYLQFITYILLGLQLSTFYGRDIGTLGGCPKLPLSLIAFVFATDENETDTMSIEMRRIQENMNFLLVAIMTATFAALEITVITFPMEAKTVKREWRNGWYRVSSYFMGRSLADLPFQVLFVLTFCTVIYTLTGQIGLTTWRFASFITIIMLTALIAQTIGFIFGALFMDNLPAAVFTAPLCIFPALLFSGFFSRVSQIPSFYMPMTYLSHFRYAFDALLVTLYGYDRCQCDQDALHAYHASLENQTSTMKTMFQSLFGSSDCGDSAATTAAHAASDEDENSIEDVTMSPALLPNPAEISLRSLITNATAATIKPKIHTLEDALVDGIFEHMIRNSTDLGTSTSSPAAQGESAMDNLSYKFSNRVTSMLNRRSNFGHDIPKECTEFKSYLMAEFDINNDDLLFGLMMLVIAVVVSRIVCNIILSFTIATRAT